MPTGRVPGPIGLTTTSGQMHHSAHPAGFGKSAVGAGTEYEEFWAKVLAAAIRDRFRKGRKRFADLAVGELSPIEKGKVMRSEGATR
jgi:hypothetical protein